MATGDPGSPNPLPQLPAPTPLRIPGLYLRPVRGSIVSSRRIRSSIDRRGRDCVPDSFAADPPGTFTTEWEAVAAAAAESPRTAVRDGEDSGGVEEISVDTAVDSFQCSRTSSE